MTSGTSLSFRNGSLGWGRMCITNVLSQHAECYTHIKGYHTRHVHAAVPLSPSLPVRDRFMSDCITGLQQPPRCLCLLHHALQFSKSGLLTQVGGFCSSGGGSDFLFRAFWVLQQRTVNCPNMLHLCFKGFKVKWKRSALPGHQLVEWAALHHVVGPFTIRMFADMAHKWWFNQTPAIWELTVCAEGCRRHAGLLHSLSPSLSLTRSHLKLYWLWFASSALFPHTLYLSQQYNYNCPLLWFLLPHFPPTHRSRFLPPPSLLLHASLPPCFHSSRFASSPPFNIDWGQRSQRIKCLNQVYRDAYIR